MRRHSPYNYAFNNPIFWIDPDGRSPMVNTGYSQISASAASFSAEVYDFKDYSSSGSSSGDESKSNTNEQGGNANNTSTTNTTNTTKSSSSGNDGAGLGGGCEDCDMHIEGDPIYISAISRTRGMSFSGAMPDWMRRGGNQEYWRWYYYNYYKPQFDGMVADMHNAQSKVGLVTLSTPLVIIGAIKAAPLLYAGAQSASGVAFSSYRAAYNFGNTYYYSNSINAWASAATSAGATLMYRYGSQMSNAITGYRGVQSLTPSYNFNVNLVGPVGNYIYGTFSKSPLLDRPFAP